MKPVDSNMDALLPVLERIAGALERIDSRLGSIERFNKISKWYDQFLKVTTSVSAESIATMKTAVLETVPHHYLTEESQKLSGEELEQWYRKLVFFQRIYEYLFATTSYSDWPRALYAKDKAEERELLEGLRDEEYSVLRWIQELVRDADFRMVHVRQGQYYPRFAVIVDRILEHAANTADERGEKELSAEIRTIRHWAKSEIEFGEFCKLDQTDTTHKRICAFIQAKGYNPHKKEDFRWVWVKFPNFQETSDEDLTH